MIPQISTQRRNVALYQPGEVTLIVERKLKGGLNARMGWMQRAATNRAERRAVAVIYGTLPSHVRAGIKGWGKWKVDLIRVGTRPVDDDNLQGMFKAVRDEVAALIGIDDGSDRIKFLYGQLKGDPHFRVTIRRVVTA